MVAAKIKLSDLTREAIDLFEDAYLFLNPDSGEQMTLMQDEMEQAEDAGPDSDWESEGGLSLAKFREIVDDWLMVPKPETGGDGRRIERFISSVPKAARDRLREAFSGRSRFRRFRSELHALGIREAWEDYRAREHAVTLLAWAEAHGVPIVRDMAVGEDGDAEPVTIEALLSPADVVRAFAQAVTDADFKEIRRLLGSEVVLHDSIGKQVHGVAATLRRWQDIVADAPGYAMNIDRAMEQGEVVCAFGSISGSVIGQGAGARVLRFRGPAAWEVRLRGQQVVEWREYVDHSAVRASQRGAEE